jgi:hypothetical protein
LLLNIRDIPNRPELTALVTIGDFHDAQLADGLKYTTMRKLYRERDPRWVIDSTLHPRLKCIDIREWPPVHPAPNLRITIGSVGWRIQCWRIGFWVR